MPAPTLAQREATRVRPAASPVMFQHWRDLLFLHWTWDVAALQATLPPGLHVDTHEGRAYLGVVPFWMDRVRPRFCPPVPGLSWFMELNLRTYVHTDDGTPGVWFYSLDCNNPVAVKLARTFFGLNYVRARQTGTRAQPLCHTEGSTTPKAVIPAQFESRRLELNHPHAEPNHYCYAGTTAPALAIPGSLEYFLAERYLLFSYKPRTKTLFSGRVWHLPYTLSPARVSRAETTALFRENGFQAPTRPDDHAMVSPGVDVSIFGLQRLGP